MCPSCCSEQGQCSEEALLYQEMAWSLGLYQPHDCPVWAGGVQVKKFMFLLALMGLWEASRPKPQHFSGNRAEILYRLRKVMAK